MSDNEFESSVQDMIHNNDALVSFLRGWFFDQEIQMISREDVTDWLAGTFWNTDIDHINAHQSALISRWIGLFEKKAGLALESRGDKELIPKIVITRDPITIYHKPLIHYIAVRMANFSAWIILSAMGFQKYKGIFGLSNGRISMSFFLSKG